MTGGLAGEAQRLATVQEHLGAVEKWTQVTAHTHRVHRPLYGRVASRSCTIKSGVCRGLPCALESKIRSLIVLEISNLNAAICLSAKASRTYIGGKSPQQINYSVLMFTH